MTGAARTRRRSAQSLYGRIVLPRLAVELHIPQAAASNPLDVYLIDGNGQRWPACIKSWANGVNKRQVVAPRAWPAAT